MNKNVLHRLIHCSWTPPNMNIRLFIMSFDFMEDLHLHLSWQRTLWAGSFRFVTCFCVRCCSCDHTKTAKEEFFWWASWQLLKLLSVRMMKSAASQNLKSYLGSSFLLHFNPQNTLSLINPYSHMWLFNPQWFLTQESHPHTQMDTWGWTWASVSDTGWLQKPGIQSLPSISPEPQLPTGQVSGLTNQRQWTCESHVLKK